MLLAPEDSERKALRSLPAVALRQRRAPSARGRSKSQNSISPISHALASHQSPLVCRSSIVARRSPRVACQRHPFLSLFVLTVANPFLTTEIQPPRNRFRENRVIILCWTRGDAKSTTRIPNGQTQNSISPISHALTSHQSLLVGRSSIVARRSPCVACRRHTLLYRSACSRWLTLF